MAQKKESGWEYGEIRDNYTKKHPLIVDFELLPPSEIKKDIDAVENIFKLLKKAGLRVYRVV